MMIKQNKPLVTIAIPTYNRADGYLKQSLSSAVRQTYQNIEIIVSDNCSTDNTRMFVKSFNDSRIRYFRQKENVKMIHNFNFCVEQARGVYFLLLHDDDEIDDDFVETCMNMAKYSADIGIIRTGMRRIDQDGNVLYECPNFAGGLSTEDFFMTWFQGKTPMHVCMSLFNTNMLKKIGSFNPEYHLFPDVLVEVQLAAEYGRVDIEDVKASYRMHPTQSNNSAKIKAWCKESFVLFDLMRNLVKEKKELFNVRGKAFFFSHNYNIARKIRPSIDRFRSYLVIINSFGYLYSIRYQFSSMFLSKLRGIIEKR